MTGTVPGSRSSITGPRAALACAAAAISLAGCGGGGARSSTSSPAPLSAQPLTQSLAGSSDVIVASSEPGPTPFISFVTLQGSNVANVARIEYTISPKPGAVSKPVDVMYPIRALAISQYLTPGTVRLPVFGLYAGFQNQVSVELFFTDASTQTLTVTIATAPYVDPAGVYDHLTINRARAPGTVLGFDFFAMKSALGAPVIADTDGEIRWTAPGIANSFATAFSDGHFLIGDLASPTTYVLGLDGILRKALLQTSQLTNFTHNIDAGKFGLLGEFDATLPPPPGGSVPIRNIGATVAEISPRASIIRQWDLAAIISAYMHSQGDDPSLFVRLGTDWFHINSTTYDANDDTVIVSSRENFVIKLDYTTGDIIWIFGDPKKYWYSFPSLRAKALTLPAGDLYPIGQHGLSITSDGLLMLFNDGEPSLNQPAGAPAGDSIAYSAVSAYAIDTAAATAHEVWRFDYGQSIFSPFCSSAYESAGSSYLVDYALANGGSATRLVGLDSNRNVIFDFAWPANFSCATSWNAIPIPLDRLVIDEPVSSPALR
jgi:arylsulfate sulfotransferase